MKRYGILGIGILIGLALMLVGWQIFESNYTYQGSLIDPPIPAADFTLTDQNGETFTLSQQQGKVVLIFFGYTNCPDVCPVTLSEYTQVKRQLQDQAEGVEFVFITVDPERDTPERMQTYMANFDPEFTGLSADRAELEPVWKAYGVYQEKVDSSSAAGYLVDHTARTYAIDKQGNWRLTYPFGMEVEKLTADVRHLLSEE